MSTSVARRVAKGVGISALAVVLLALGLLALSSARLIAVAVTLVLFVALLVPAIRKRKRILSGLALLLLISFVSPYDVSLRNLPGRPHFVPLVMGTLSPEGRAKKERGEFVGGGCMVSGLEPSYVLAW